MGLNRCKSAFIRVHLWFHFLGPLGPFCGKTSLFRMVRVFSGVKWSESVQIRVAKSEQLEILSR